MCCGGGLAPAPSSSASERRRLRRPAQPARARSRPGRLHRRPPEVVTVATPRRRPRRPRSPLAVAPPRSRGGRAAVLGCCRVLAVPSRRHARPDRGSSPGERRRARSSTATPWSSTSAAPRRAVRLIGIDTPETRRPGPAGRVLRRRGVAAASPTCCPPGTAVRLERDVEPRDRYDRLLAYVYRAPRRPVRELALVDGGLRRRPRYPPNVAHRADFERAERAARTAGRGLWAACGGADVPARASRPADLSRPTATGPGSLHLDGLARRTPRVPRRRPAADRQLRRPRLEPRRQRRRVRGAARRHRHQRLADGPVPVGPRGGRRATGARTSACTSRSTPSTTCYRWGPITHAPSLLDGDGGFPRTRRRPVGPRRPRRGPPRAAGPGRAGDPVGLRRQPPRQPHGRAAAQARVLRHLPRPGRRLRPAAPAVRRRRPSAAIGFPFRRLAAEEGVVFPDHFVQSRGVGSRRAIERRCPTCRRASPRSTSTRPSTPPSCGRSPPTGRPGSTTTTWSSTTTALRAPARAGRRRAHRLPRAPRPPARRAADRRLTPEPGLIGAPPSDGRAASAVWVARRRGQAACHHGQHPQQRRLVAGDLDAALHERDVGVGRTRRQRGDASVVRRGHGHASASASGRPRTGRLDHAPVLERRPVGDRRRRARR